MQSISSGRTPELPLARELVRTSIEARTQDSGIVVAFAGSVVGRALAKTVSRRRTAEPDCCGIECAGRSMMPYCSVSISERCKPCVSSVRVSALPPKPVLTPSRCLSVIAPE